jgi:hypothetical protein
MFYCHVKKPQCLKITHTKFIQNTLQLPKTPVAAEYMQKLVFQRTVNFLWLHRYYNVLEHAQKTNFHLSAKRTSPCVLAESGCSVGYCSTFMWTLLLTPFSCFPFNSPHPHHISVSHHKLIVVNDNVPFC